MNLNLNKIEKPNEIETKDERQIEYVQTIQASGHPKTFSFHSSNCIFLLDRFFSFRVFFF